MGLPPLFRRRIKARISLHSTIHTREPIDAVLDELLDTGAQLRLVQMQIVHGADAQDAGAREAGADAVHERAARVAEVVGHGEARRDGRRVRPRLQVLPAPHVPQVLVVDGEVRREHGRCDFAAVRAVAYEGVDETGLRGRLRGVRSGCCTMGLGEH